MLCAHCDHPMTWRQTISFRLDGGIKCLACGKTVFMKFTKRRDPAGIVLGFVAVFAVLLYFAGRNGSRVFFTSALGLGVFGIVVQTAIFWIRAIGWSHTVASLSRDEVQRRKRFYLGLMLYVFSAATYFTTTWIGSGQAFGQIALIVGFLTAIFTSHHSRSVSDKRSAANSTIE